MNKNTRWIKPLKRSQKSRLRQELEKRKKQEQTEFKKKQMVGYQMVMALK